MSPRTILVVDDEPDLQMLMLQRFRQKVKSKTYEFIFAEDGREAIGLLKENSAISLILSDINMPRMDGLTMLSELQGLNRENLKTVMVSAYGDMDNIRIAMNRGAYDFVTKPIDFKDLETTIEKSIREIERIEKAIQLQSEYRAMTTDLDLAAKIQQQILQKEFPAFPDDERFDIFAQMIAAKHVGGDFYDFFRYDEESIAFFIGDVSGKGMPAAIYMAVCDTMLKSIGSEVRDPAECLSKVNQMLIPISEMTTFVTVFYGLINLKTGELSYSNGGHNLPYIQKPDGTVEEIKDVGGLLLGKFAFAQYQSNTITLKPGESIITFTDGVTEAEDEDDNQYEEERLIEYLAKTADKSTPSIIKGAFLDVMKFSGAAPQSDDITMLGIRFNGGDT